ncbi:MAG: hypothetical protein K0Q81_1410, partial [Paenibacillus sp.]|nr:hypothetical protein [Paenibacillus sp.]
MSAAAAAAVKDQPVAPLRSIPHSGELDHVQSASEVMAPDKPLKHEGMNIRYRYTELFALEKQGKSIDHIAKKLGMNKGEVMLIIQLAKQEDRTRA